MFEVVIDGMIRIMAMHQLMQLFPGQLVSIQFQGFKELQGCYIDWQEKKRFLTITKYSGRMSSLEYNRLMETPASELLPRYKQLELPLNV